MKQSRRFYKSLISSDSIQPLIRIICRKRIKHLVKKILVGGRLLSRKKSEFFHELEQCSSRVNAIKLRINPDIKGHWLGTGVLNLR